MKSEVKVLIGVGVATILILVLAVFVLNKTTPKTQTAQTQAADPKVLVRDDSYKINVSSSSATLVEFGDYQCPACDQAFPVVEDILKENKVNFVFRNFPLPQHQNAQIAAEAAEAAGAQGKYYEMYKLLYENQTSWADSTDPLGFFIQYAKVLSLNTSQFTADIKSDKFQSKINRDIQDGNSLGVNATPTFYLNNRPVTNLNSWSDLKTVVDNLK